MYARFLYNMEQMAEICKLNQEPFKVKAYQAAIKKIKSFKGEFGTIDDIKSLKLGKGTTERLTWIFENNEDLPDVVNAVGESSDMASIQELSTVHNIGHTKAKSLVQKDNIKNIADLRKNTHLLNKNQVKGLLYHDYILMKIPRKEMILFDTKIKSIFSECFPTIQDFEMVGSYRRGCDESGDIDLIVAVKDNEITMKQLTNTMIKKGLLLKDGVFALGPLKFMGMCKVDENPRRIDILFCDPHEYVMACLYFTGSKEYNVLMRERAKALGYTLNEKSLSPCDDTFINEEQVFQKLGIKYMPPHMRQSENFMLKI